MARALRKLQTVNISPAVKKEGTAQVAMALSSGWLQSAWNAWHSRPIWGEFASLHSVCSNR